MQGLIISLGLVAAVLAAPAPDAHVPRSLKVRQVGGNGGGYVPGASGTLSGFVPASGLPFGCIGGSEGGEGVTICARGAAPTPAPAVKKAARQVGGGLSGFVPSASGFVSGMVPASGLPYGCIGGGVLGPDGITICAREAAPTPAPEIKNAARQVGGGLSGFVPSASGFVSGVVPASGLPYGCIGGGVLGPDGVTICARAAAPTPAPIVKRQVGGGLGGSVGSGIAGSASGFVPPTGDPFGCIGGIVNGEGATACAKKARAEPTFRQRYGESYTSIARQPGSGFGFFEAPVACQGREAVQAGVTACPPDEVGRKRRD